MQDYRVRTFLEACRTMNYTRAAKALHITQPAVSQHISFLEKEYGAKLFAHDGKKLVLTDAGKMLRNALSTMAHDDEVLHERIRSLTDSRTISLRIGLTLTAGEYIVATPLAAYLGKHPEIRMTVHSGGTKELLAAIDSGDLDCAFVEGLFDKSPYAWDTYSTEKLICICAPLLLPHTEFSFEELLGMRLLVREPGSGTRAVLERALASRNLSIDSFAEVCQIDSLDIIKVFVAEGLGISFLYEAAVKRELAHGSLQEVRLKGPAITHDITFVRLKESIFEEEMRMLFENMKAMKEPVA